MNNPEYILCSFFQLCPLKKVSSIGEYSYVPSDAAYDMSFRSVHRLRLSEDYPVTDGGIEKQTVLTATLRDEIDHSAISLLSSLQYRYYVAQVTTASGSCRVYGSERYPARLELSRSDQDYTLTLTINSIAL